MTIEQTIYDVIELSKRSNVPFLLLSNPGYGKTTIINKWAKENGYHVEAIIGSRFTPEEIMGYQVNEPGKTSLVHKNPEWYDNIAAYEKKGIPSILFEDEISTCPDYVQGALLDLNFSRKIGNGNELPKDCIVLSAANYAENLPNSMNIITPSLNRFCLINLLEGKSNLDIIDEFLAPHRGAIKREFIPFTKKELEDFNTKVYEDLKDFIISYSDPESSKGYLDFHNTDMGSLYADSTSAVYNVMTGRSLYYLQNVLGCMAQYSMTDKELCYQVCAGLAGEGTGTFTTDEQKDAFRSSLSLRALRLVSNYATIDEKTIDLNGTIADAVQSFLQENQKVETNASFLKTVPLLTDKIKLEFGDVIETAKHFTEGKVSEVEKSRYISDLDAIEELFNEIEKIDPDNSCINTLKKIHMSHLAFYSNLTNISLDQLSLKQKYGIGAPKTFNELRVVKMRDGGKYHGELQLLARKKHGDRDLFFAVDLNKVDSLANVAMSAAISRDNIDTIIEVA